MADFFRNEVFVMAGGNAETNARAETDSFMVKLRIDAFQDVKTLKRSTTWTSK